ncbi:hypothetical protein CDL15_Pgr019043 [Punica granatum]|uniref:Aldehyde dehydrogenase domain-containing protein n=1 Tax=Punica granatum TaxID=22663 RepID=A0A218XL69_PUNGR|nr:hypothetical protein CDL15_Pgr019043 [Punica granatum]
MDASSMPAGVLRKENGHPVKVPNFIGGKFLESQGSEVVDVINPETQEVVSQFPMTTDEEFKAAVNAAQQAFPSWKNTPAATRQSIIFKLHDLICRNTDKLAMVITEEQGKTLKAAEADVLLGLEAVEQTCGMATLHAREYVPNASKSVDTICITEPLGVCAGICLSNFPATVPLWMFPIAVTCGNTFVLKTCEKNPGVSMVLAELAKEAGLPDGVLNIIHGTDVGMHICTRAAVQGKRVQANFGGKSYAIILPDANLDATMDALVPKGIGAAGQQGMALSIAIFVGGLVPWEKELVARAKALKVNEGTNPGADLGPVISREVKDRTCTLVDMAVESGARLVLDGRNIMVPRYESGNFIGPTILCDVTTRMDCYKEEISGPVLLCMQVGSLEEAVTIINRNKHAIGAALFTTSGVTARNFQNDIQTGLVGINTAPPFALPFFSLNGSKSSLTVKESVQFYTQTKLVAQQWKDLSLRPMLLMSPPSAEISLSAQGASELQSTSENESPPSQGSPVTGTASDDRDSLSSPTPDRDYLPNWRVPNTAPSMDGLVPPERERDLQTRGELVSQITTTLHGTESDRTHVPYLPTVGNSNSPGSMMAAESSGSERAYMLTTFSPLNQSASQALQRRTTEDTNFPVSGRSYMASTSRRNEAISFQSVSLDGMCSDVALSGIDGIASSSERMYLPSLIQRNPGMLPLLSERLHMPSTSQRLYPQNSIIPMDEFPS